jgi:hypothetical protein
MSGSDTLNLKILACVTSKLKDLGSEVLHDSSSIDSSSSTYTLVRVNTLFEKTVNTTDRELKVGTLRARHGGALGRCGLATLAAFAALTTFAAFATFTAAT